MFQQPGPGNLNLYGHCRNSHAMDINLIVFVFFGWFRVMVYLGCKNRGKKNTPIFPIPLSQGDPFGIQTIRAPTFEKHPGKLTC